VKDRVTLLLLGLTVASLVGMCFLAREKGAVTVATPGAELQLRSRLGRGMVLRSGAEPVAVPARAYRPVSLTLTGEKDGAVWKASSFGPWGKLDRIKLARGRTTAIELGPPLLIKPQVAVYPGQVRIALDLFGRSGEQYSSSILRNDQRIPGPPVKIIDEAGTVLASGQFQFG
jgi:hypothetical protein